MLKTPKFWQSKGALSTLLLPLAKIYQWISYLDLHNKAKKAQKLPKPTLVIGNINVGGTGKTPATITIAKALQDRGIKVGILSRGFGRQIQTLHIASPTSTASEMGDEPYLIYQKTQAPMAIDASRYDAGMALLKAFPEIDCFICDDALQHRQLARDIEIIVVGKQGFGNERIFPAGPLREPLSRLKKSDYILSNGANLEHLRKITTTPIISLHSELLAPVNLISGIQKSFTEFKKIPFTAIAGIAHPENFYNMLRDKGLEFTVCSFPDHHQYTEADFSPIQTAILMTEKDATKCQDLKRDNLWAVALENKICSKFIDTLVMNIHDQNSINSKSTKRIEPSIF